MVADVIYPVWRTTAAGVGAVAVEVGVGGSNAIHHPHRAFGDVVNVGEVALHLAVVEDVDRAAFENGSGKQPGRHIRAAPRAIDREIAQAGGRQAKQVAVTVRHQFVGFLCGGVQADRVVHFVVRRERHPRVGTVDAGTAGIDQVLDFVVAAALQNIAKTNQIALDVGVRVGQRVTHASLRGEMDDALEIFFGKQFVQRNRVSHVHADEAEVGIGLQTLQARQLQLRVVVIIEVVDADHIVAAFQKNAGDVESDKAGSAGKQDFHGGLAVEKPCWRAAGRIAVVGSVGRQFIPLLAVEPGRQEYVRQGALLDPAVLCGRIVHLQVLGFGLVDAVRCGFSRTENDYVLPFHPAVVLLVLHHGASRQSFRLLRQVATDHRVLRIYAKQ